MQGLQVPLGWLSYYESWSVQHDMFCHENIQMSSDRSDRIRVFAPEESRWGMFETAISKENSLIGGK